MAGRKSRAPRVRTHLLAIQRKLARKGATKEEMIAVLREDHPEVIRAEMQDIVHIGLVSIANSLCNLRLGVASGLQIDLFEGYDVPRTVTLQVVDTSGQIRAVIKSLDTLTKAEARQYVADHAKPPRRSRRVEGVRLLLDYIGDNGADDWTLKRCWGVAQVRRSSL